MRQEVGDKDHDLECLHEETENCVCMECGEYIEGLFGEYESNPER